MNDTMIQQYLDHPETLLDDIDNALEEADPASLPFALMKDGDEREPYRGVRDGKVFHSVLDQMLERIRGVIVKYVCVGSRYCELRKAHASSVECAAVVLDAITIHITQLPIPAATLACYLVGSTFLSNVCKCDAA